jgi:hypothetical protein
VPLLHSWIQSHAIPDHLLVDVANYEHVHNGPGVVLVAHEANYSLDHRGGRFGLTYQRKQPLAGGLPERLKSAFGATLAAAVLLNEKLKFRTDEVEFRICDRLAAPNSSDTFESIKFDLMNVWPKATLLHQPSEIELFTVMIRPAGPIAIGNPH